MEFKSLGLGLWSLKVQSQGGLGSRGSALALMFTWIRVKREAGFSALQRLEFSGCGTGAFCKYSEISIGTTSGPKALR